MFLRYFLCVEMSQESGSNSVFLRVFFRGFAIEFYLSHHIIFGLYPYPYVHVHVWTVEMAKIV
jgi:hypothetical protein